MVTNRRTKRPIVMRLAIVLRPALHPRLPQPAGRPTRTRRSCDTHPAHYNRAISRIRRRAEPLGHQSNPGLPLAQRNLLLRRRVDEAECGIGPGALPAGAVALPVSEDPGVATA